MDLDNKNKILVAGKNCLDIQLKEIANISSKLDDNFAKAVELIYNHSGKIIITGVGKSGHIGKKIAATLSSTGTRAVFMHPAEAVHGDLGIYKQADPTILISKSGSTDELLRLVPILKQFSSPMIALVGNPSSTLAKEADFFLDASVEKEADPLNLVPTSSTSVALVWGDCLAAALMARRNFGKENFARFHPAGQLGKNLLLKVLDVMHKKEEVALVNQEDSLKELVIKMTKKPLGAACILDDNQNLLGIITDGDIRRAFTAYDDIRTLKAKDIMTKKPVFISPNSSLGEAIEIMESKSKQISVLPVMQKENEQFLGLIRLHDCY